MYQFGHDFDGNGAQVGVVRVDDSLQDGREVVVVGLLDHLQDLHYYFSDLD
jgi:hypothetical protein